MKSLTAILAAASVAAAVTLVFAPSAPVTANPMPQIQSSDMHACVERPWPYLRCVGTRYGDPRIRLVTTDNLTNQ